MPLQSSLPGATVYLTTRSDDHPSHAVFWLQVNSENTIGSGHLLRCPIRQTPRHHPSTFTEPDLFWPGLGWHRQLIVPLKLVTKFAKLMSGATYCISVALSARPRGIWKNDYIWQDAGPLELLHLVRQFKVVGSMASWPGLT